MFIDPVSGTKAQREIHNGRNIKSATIPPEIKHSGIQVRLSINCSRKISPNLSIESVESSSNLDRDTDLVCGRERKNFLTGNTKSDEVLSNLHNLWNRTESADLKTLDEVFERFQTTNFQQIFRLQSNPQRCVSMHFRDTISNNAASVLKILGQGDGLRRAQTNQDLKRCKKSETSVFLPQSTKQLLLRQNGTFDCVLSGVHAHDNCSRQRFRRLYLPVGYCDLGRAWSSWCKVRIGVHRKQFWRQVCMLQQIPWERSKPGVILNQTAWFSKVCRSN